MNNDEFNYKLRKLVWHLKNYKNGAEKLSDESGLTLEQVDNLAEHLQKYTD